MEKLKNFAPIALYGILIGMLYSFAFWDRFSINPLQFASVHDIARVAAWPLAAGALLFLINILTSSAVDEDWKQFTHMDFTLIAAPSWLKMAWRIVWGLGVTLLLAWLLVEVSTPIRWFGIGVCVLFLSASSIERQTVIREIFPSYSLRVSAVTLGVLAPFYAVGAGALAGDKIKSGNGDFILEENHSSLSATFDSSTSHAFVGVLGNLYIFYADNLTVSMVKVGDGQIISLKYNPAAKSRSYY